MQVTTIDKKFRFSPSDLKEICIANIEVSCSSDKELLFLIHHLEAFNLTDEYKKYLSHQPSKIEPVKSVESEKNKDEEVNTISSLEID